MAKRSGGRAARKALRSAPLAEETKPVHPGESGGAYKPLTEDGIAAIRENIFRILEEVGFADATPHCIETCTAVGAIMGNDGRLRMPRDVAETALAQAQTALGQRIVTPILNNATFYSAEAYHQDYYKKNPLRYKFYRRSCRRDKRLAELWETN